MAALALVGGLVSGIGSILGANAEAANLEGQSNYYKAQAAADKAKGQEERSIGQREAINRAREANLVLSKQRSIAASSGGGASDPTVLNVMANTDQQGQYNTESALYEGETKGRGMDYAAQLELMKAKMARQQAKQTRLAGFINAGTSMLSGFSSFGGSFGGFGGGSTATSGLFYG